MMKRANSAMLPEIIEATCWQPHTVRGFVSILGSKREGRRYPRTPPRPRARAIGFETLEARRRVSERVNLGQGRSLNRRNRCT